MDNDLNDVLRRIFPGDPVPDWSDDDSDDRVVGHVQARVRQRPAFREPRLAYTPTPTPPPVVVPRDPVIAQPTTRAYLLESATNAALWVRDAEEIEYQLRVGRPTSVDHVTRLMLEAIPVVQQLVK